MNIKKALAVLLSTSILMSTSVMAFPENTTNKKNTLATVETNISKQNKASGTCGEHIIWELDNNGTLTISGTGALKSTSVFEFPWAEHRFDVTTVVVENGITAIGMYAFRGFSNLISVKLPETLTKIDKFAFHFCEKLPQINIPKSVTYIGLEAFFGCWELREVHITDLTAWLKIEFGAEASSKVSANPLATMVKCCLYLNGELLTDITVPNEITKIANGALASNAFKSITIPNTVTSIGDYAFAGCQNLTSIEIPNSVTSIGEHAFYLCENLTSIEIPCSVTCIEKYTFMRCTALKDVYFDGTAAQWKELCKNIGDDNDYLLNAEIHFNDDSEIHVDGKSMIVYSDTSGLDIKVGETVTFSAGIRLDDGTFQDPSGITFQLSDASVVKVMNTEISDGQLYVTLQGVLDKTTSITFSDSTTGKSVTIPLTVYSKIRDTLTLQTVPEFVVKTGPITEGPVNFYNKNGLYVDSFRSTVSDNGIAKVSFDVYNTNHTYAVVEIYDENGEFYNVAIIDKMDNFNDSFKEVLWEGTGCFVRDIVKGNALTYKQETNFSKRTHVEIEIPKNGYISITASSMESDILAIINMADIWLASLSAVKKFDNYATDKHKFMCGLADEIIESDYIKMAKADNKFAKEMLKELHSDTIINSKTVGGLATTIYNALTELNLMEIILKGAVSAGEDILEDMITEAMQDAIHDVTGKFTAAFDAVFLIGRVEDLVLQYSSFSRTERGGVITIHNQSGGKRHCNNIVLESDVDFDQDVALEVYSVTLDDEILNKVKNADAETYKLLTSNVVRTYNISLMKNGNETQHKSDVSVHIPIPEDLELLGLNGHIKVYRIEEDGSVTDMDAVVIDDYIFFTTNHFSLYSVVGYSDDTSSSPETTQEDSTSNAIPTETDNNSVTSNDTHDDDNDENNDIEKSDNSNVAVIVIIIVSALAVCGVAAFFILKKKKQ